jgi:hypothetical protein
MCTNLQIRLVKKGIHVPWGNFLSKNPIYLMEGEGHSLLSKNRPSYRIHVANLASRLMIGNANNVSKVKQAESLPYLPNDNVRGSSVDKSISLSVQGMWDILYNL